MRPCKRAAGPAASGKRLLPGWGNWPVNGRDLMALGAKPGPGLRGQLEALLEAVITGQLPNERKALLAAVKIELDP